jgi:hypothetical protein
MRPAYPISNSNDRVFTAPAKGNYAVIITYNGCSDTSDCTSIAFTGIIENSLNSSLVLFPNPTDGLFNIDLGSVFENIRVSIKDMQGREVVNAMIGNSRIFPFNLNEPAGIYLITISADDRKAIIKLIKK